MKITYVLQQSENENSTVYPNCSEVFQRDVSGECNKKDYKKGERYTPGLVNFSFIQHLYQIAQSSYCFNHS